MNSRRIGLVVATLALATLASGARAQASAESVERLMEVMKVQNQVETMHAQTIPAMQNAMRQALRQQIGSAEAERMFDAMAPRIGSLLREEMSWARLKPDFAVIYAEGFSQQEIDGLIAFYQGPIGKALIDKLPQLTQRSIQLMQQRMGPMMERTMQIAREEVEKEMARSGSKR
jgi:hypothetical protein